MHKLLLLLLLTLSAAAQPKPALRNLRHPVRHHPSVRRQRPRRRRRSRPQARYRHDGLAHPRQQQKHPRRRRLLPRPVLQTVESLGLPQTFRRRRPSRSQARRHHRRHHHPHALGPRRRHGPLPQRPHLGPEGRARILRRQRLAIATHPRRYRSRRVLSAVKLNLAGKLTLVNGDAQEILPASPATPAASIPTPASSLAWRQPRATSSSPATTCTCTKTWRSTSPSPPRSTPIPISARRIA